MVILGLVAPFLLGFIQSAISSQPASNPAPEAQSIPATPADPNERLELGQKLNGLQRVDVPWHLKASYEVFDAEGKSKGKGTFEEWWVSEKQYKLAYHSAEFSQEEYGTDNGIFHSGATVWAASPVSQLQRIVSQPFPLYMASANLEERTLERKLGTARLTCTAVSYRGHAINEDSASFCFEPKNAMLRYSNTSNRANQTLYSDFVLFHGHLVARDIRFLLLGKPSLAVHIDAIETLKEADLSSMRPPTNSSRVTRRVHMSSLEIDDHLIQSNSPAHPASATKQTAKDVVAVEIIISKEGHVRETHVLAGPEWLRNPVMEIVRQLTFKPFWIDGETVEVETEVDLIFNLPKTEGAERGARFGPAW